MGIVWRLVRYALIAVMMVALIVGIKACSSPSKQASDNTTSTAINAENSTNSKAKININTAILSELDKLEAKLGVPALSHRIQASRPYGSVEDLVSKKVLDPAQFDQVKTQITVEEVVLTGVARDVDYMTKLGLMKGHMLVANELLALNQPKQAEPHLGHPVEEIYVDLEDQFQERSVPAFKDMLMQVQNLVKSKPSDPQVQPKFGAAMKAIDTAIAVLPETQRLSPSFGMQVINGLLETATSEYTAAIANGKISAAIEYQDSRGFVTYAQQTYQQIAPKIKQANASTVTQLDAAFADLRKAWPQPIPPVTPVLSSDQVAAKIKQVEMLGRPIATASAS